MKKYFSLFLGAIMLLQSFNLGAQSAAPSTKWFEDAKYGLFLHFGLYSIAAGQWDGKNYYGITEWLQKRAKMPIAEYEKFAAQFNPSGFNAEKWVQFAKDNGFKYIVITAKHHDGFAMFGSKVSKFNIVDATPFKRDLLKELATACKKLDMKLGFYYSQSQDWHEADAIGNDWDFPGYKRNFQKYLDEKCKPQLKELLTNYGDVAILWFDTPQEITKEESQQLVDWVHQFQPNCLTSSRVGNGLGDYQALQDHNLPTQIINRPFEALFTHNDSWGYSKLDKNFRSPKEILTTLLASNTMGGNLILNIGPKSEGVFQEETITDFNVVGKWLKRNNEAVYGSKASPFANMQWGYITTKPGTIYLHILKWPKHGELRLPDAKVKFSKVNFLVTGTAVPFSSPQGELILKLPVKAPDELCTVIKINYSETLDPGDAIPVGNGYTTTLIAEQATVQGLVKIVKDRWMEEFGDWHYANFVTDWKSQTDKAEWKLQVAAPGKYHVMLNYHYPSKNKVSEGVLTLDGVDAIYFQSLTTGDNVKNCFEHSIGVIDIKKAGTVMLGVFPSSVPESFIKLWTIKLVPYE